MRECRKTNRRVFSLVASLLLLASFRASASWDEFTLRGYVKDLVGLHRTDPHLVEPGLRLSNTIHMRQNLRWYPTYTLTGALEVKTQFAALLIENEALDGIEPAAEGVPEFGQARYFDWSWTPIDQEDVTLMTTIDRAWIDWYAGQTQVTAGRQRIAWGTNLAWNPIDLFNPYSPLDFDNEEKPGTDGLRFQYYTGPSSKVEVAVAPAEEFEKSVAAVLVKINKWRYDLHFLAGRRGRGTVVGTAWAGQIRGGGFRGEALYTYPDEDSHVLDPYVVAGVSGDYTFPNSFYLLGEVLLNQRGTTGPAGGLHWATAIAEGELTPARTSLFGQVALNITPLIRGGISGILNPHDRSWYIGPSIDQSLATDLDFTAIALIFGGDEGTEFGDLGQMLFLRLKMSF